MEHSWECLTELLTGKCTRFEDAFCLGSAGWLCPGITTVLDSWHQSYAWNQHAWYTGNMALGSVLSTSP